VRYLVYFLLIANLGYFAWYMYQPAPAPRPVQIAPLPPGPNQLVLLSERSALRAEGTAPDPSGSAESASPPTQSPEPVAAMEPVVAPEAGQAVQAPEKLPPPADAPRPSDDAPAAAVVAGPVEPVCQTLGPFLKKHDVTAVFARLARNGYVVNVRDGDVREPNGYWVYLPAMEASEARGIVADLDAHGMKDYYIGKQNYISLGIFSAKDKAERRQREVKRLGYDAILDQRFRTRDVYWVDVDASETPLLDSEVWQQIQAQHPDVRAQRVSCE